MKKHIKKAALIIAIMMAFSALNGCSFSKEKEPEPEQIQNEVVDLLETPQPVVTVSPTLQPTPTIKPTPKPTIEPTPVPTPIVTHAARSQKTVAEPEKTPEPVETIKTDDTYVFEKSDETDNEDVNADLDKPLGETDLSDDEDVETNPDMPDVEETPEPTTTPDATPNPTLSPEPEETDKPEPTPTPTVDPEPTATPEPEETKNPEPTPEPQETEKPNEEKIYLVVSKIKVDPGNVLYVRALPKTTSAILDRLNPGDVMTAIDMKAFSGWYQVLTASGKVGYVSADYVEMKDGSTLPEQPKDKEKEEVNKGSGEISIISAKVQQYKTIYINGSIGGSTSGIKWTSSNSDVAEVYTKSGYNGKAFVYAKGTGTATIKLLDSNGNVKSTCEIKVIDAEPVRTVYSQQNTPSAGQSFNLKAVTDTNKTAVKFIVSGPNGVDYYETESYETETKESSVGLPDNSVKVFAKNVSFNSSGEYTVSAYAKSSDGNWLEAFKTNTFRVVSTQDKSTTSRDVRSASSEIIKFIGEREGYRPEVYIDTIATGTPPTVGYGLLVNLNTTFYDTLTPSEMEGQLNISINTGNYASAVEKFRSNNDMAMSQQQFDAIVSFAYNLGGGSVTTSYETFKIMTNAVAFPGYEVDGYLNVSNLSLYNGTGSGALVIGTVAKDTKVRVSLVAVNEINLTGSSPIKERWYHVTTSSGAQGWVRAGGVRLETSNGIDLMYVDEQMVGSRLLGWNLAGGQRWPGLVKRRLVEAKIFCYGGYEENFDTALNVGFNIPASFEYRFEGGRGIWTWTGN